MIEIRIDDDPVTAALAQLTTRMTDMTKPMGDIGELLVASTKDRTLSGRSPDGTAFAPRSQTTLERYASRNPPLVPGGGPLNLSGNMIAGIFPEAGRDFARIGSNAIQAAVMQFGQPQGASGRTSRGGPIPWGNIPARPFLGLSDDDRTGIIAIITEWLEGVVE